MFLIPVLGAAAVGAGIYYATQAADEKLGVSGMDEDDLGAVRGGGRRGGYVRHQKFKQEHPKAAARLAAQRKQQAQGRRGRGGRKAEPLADFDGTSIMDPEWFMEEGDESGSIFAAGDWGLRHGVTVDRYEAGLSGVGAEISVMPNLRRFARGGVARRSMQGITPFSQVPPGFGR
jgi:hypothetical protein